MLGWILRGLLINLSLGGLPCLGATEPERQQKRCRTEELSRDPAELKAAIFAAYGADLVEFEALDSLIKSCFYNSDHPRDPLTEILAAFSDEAQWSNVYSEFLIRCPEDRVLAQVLRLLNGRGINLADNAQGMRAATILAGRGYLESVEVLILSAGTRFASSHDLYFALFDYQPASPHWEALSEKISHLIDILVRRNYEGIPRVNLAGRSLAHAWAAHPGAVFNPHLTSVLQNIMSTSSRDQLGNLPLHVFRCEIAGEAAQNKFNLLMGQNIRSLFELNGKGETALESMGEKERLLALGLSAEYGLQFEHKDLAFKFLAMLKNSSGTEFKPFNTDAYPIFSDLADPKQWACLLSFVCRILRELNRHPNPLAFDEALKLCDFLRQQFGEEGLSGQNSLTRLYAEHLRPALAGALEPRLVELLLTLALFSQDPRPGGLYRDQLGQLLTCARERLLWVNHDRDLLSLGLIWDGTLEACFGSNYASECKATLKSQALKFLDDLEHSLFLKCAQQIRLQVRQYEHYQALLIEAESSVPEEQDTEWNKVFRSFFLTVDHPWIGAIGMAGQTPEEKIRTGAKDLHRLLERLQSAPLNRIEALQPRFHQFAQGLEEVLPYLDQWITIELPKEPSS